ncbi:hypothetical protein GE09DRAFT_1189173 [Coniochaeta sp. 2T2.1]|nr:hypothetical protein GE09DRAFT_1189173 [Coniochaeta sp. 2T2.1]
MYSRMQRTAIADSYSQRDCIFLFRDLGTSTDVCRKRNLQVESETFNTLSRRSTIQPHTQRQACTAFSKRVPSENNMILLLLLLPARSSCYKLAGSKSKVHKNRPQTPQVLAASLSSPSVQHLHTQTDQLLLSFPVHRSPSSCCAPAGQDNNCKLAPLQPAKQQHEPRKHAFFLACLANTMLCYAFCDATDNCIQAKTLIFLLSSLSPSPLAK